MLQFSRVCMAFCLLNMTTYCVGQTFMPPNNLHLETVIPTMTKAQFDQVLNKIDAFYKPLIKNDHNAELVINRRWNDPTVNASATQSGRFWILNMYGGLARRVTMDGLLAVACHETGHLVAGFPFVALSWPAANEGQSDYFATLSCLRELLRDEKQVNESYIKIIPKYPKALCDKAWEAPDDRALCYRILMASKSLSDLLSNGTAKWETPDTHQVFETDDDHPWAQCRMDTYLAGAVCGASFDKDIIPGKELGSARNSIQAERESAQYTCNGAQPGSRPRCWFFPRNL